MGYGGTTNPALLAAIRRQPKEIQPELLATTWAESGGNPYGRPGDNGQSFGAYQEYTGGRGAGIPEAQRRDPVASTQRAAREFLQYKAKGLSGGALAAAAQRPADAAGYTTKVDSYLADARRVLGSSAVDAITSSPATGISPNKNAAQGGAESMLSSVQAAVGARQRGESLLHSVMTGVMNSSLGSPATTQRNGITANPQGNGPGGGAAGGVFQSAFKKAEGLPYTWGGGTPSGPTRGFAQGANTVGYDCSSLAQMLWSKAGVSLPRVTYDQIKVGRGINAADRNQWRVGDLLFPSTGHVQIYAGNGKVWEAPRTGGFVQHVPARNSYIAVRRPKG